MSSYESQYEHEDINVLSDPKVVGPGVWWLVHTYAKDSIDTQKIKKFIDFMNFLRENFSCKNCRKHINQYMDLHPFDDLKNLKNQEGRLIGMFKWSWLFHNAVNTRIGKPYIEWETAVNMFYNETEVCSKNCEEAGDSNVNEIKEEIKELPDNRDRRSKLAQGYFMTVGIPKTLKQTRSEDDYVSYVKNYTTSV